MPEMVENISVLVIESWKKMTESLTLKCKKCDKEEEIVGISFDFYMEYIFVPNGIDEICENCGNDSMVPIKSKTVEYCDHWTLWRKGLWILT